MKRAWMLLVLLAGMFLAGCEGMVHSYPERDRRFRNINDYYVRQMVDDIDEFWLADRPMQMSYWHIRDGD